MNARTRVVCIVCLLVLAAAVAPHTQTPATGRRLLITGATMIDGTGGAPLAGASILIADGKIEAVGRADAVKAPADAQVIRADGKFVLPGLWESHMHYRGWHGDLTLHYGVTTAVDMGNPTEWALAIKDGTEKGHVHGPRLFATGWILHGTPSGGGGGGRERYTRSEAYNEYHVRENHPNHLFLRGGVDKLRAFVRSELEQGLDGLKVFPDMTREELRAITAEADRAGVPVIGHTEDAYASVEDGLDAITHVQGIARTLMNPDKVKELRAGHVVTPYAWMDRSKMDALVQFLVKHGTYLGPCLIHDHAPAIAAGAAFEAEDARILARPELNYISDDTRIAMRDYLHMYRGGADAYGDFPVRELLPAKAVEEYQVGYENAKEFVRRFAKAGGKLFIGTDLGGTAFVPGLIVHREMQVWVEEVGLTPMQAILAATRDSAALMRKDKVLGTIETGKIADLLIVDGDPLGDIKNTQKINTVIKDGRVMDRALRKDYFVPFREIGSEGAHNTSFAVPGVIELRPRVAVEGAGETTVVLEGVGLHMTSRVYVNEELVPSRMLDVEHLELKIPAHLLARGGSLAVTVVNGMPGGGRSKAYGFVVRFK